MAHATHKTPRKLLVIGNGMVGHRYLEELVKRHPDLPAAGLEVTVLGEEPRPAYDRVHLSEFFSGRSADDLSLVPPGFYDRPGLTLRLNARVQSIERRNHTVMLADGEVLDYDKLVLATGSAPFVPGVPGRERPHCFVYRTIEDLEAMQASVPSRAAAWWSAAACWAWNAPRPCATSVWKRMWSSSRPA